MAWHEIPVIGHPDRNAVKRMSLTSGAHVKLELDGDALPPHTTTLMGMWFLSLSITSFSATPDTDRADTADEAMMIASFTGTITDTDIPVRLTFFGEVLDRAEVDLNP